jgi:hypothetical protein
MKKIPQIMGRWVCAVCKLSHLHVKANGSRKFNPPVSRKDSYLKDNLQRWTIF